MELNTYIITTFLSLVANLGLSIAVLTFDPKNRVNRIYALLAFSVTFWALMKLGQAFAATPETATLCYRIGGLCWVFLPITYVHFVSAYMNRTIFGTGRYSGPLLLLVAASIYIALWVDGLMIKDMIPGPWGLTHVPGPLAPMAYQPYLLAVFVYATVELSRFAVKAKGGSERARTLLIITGIILPLAGGAITEMFLPIWGIHVFELAVPLTTINAGLIAYAILRYKIFLITFEYAASTIIDTMGDSLIVVDNEGIVSLVNPATEKLLGWKADEIKGRHINEFMAQRLFSEKYKRETEARGITKSDVVFLDKEGTSIHISLSVSAVGKKDGAAAGYVLVARDVRETKKLISQIEAAREKLEELAVTDPLTEVYNRRFLMLKLKEEHHRALRYRHPFSIALVDLDRFKEINDRFGHSKGDKVLKTIAGWLKSSTRATDTVARFGGDEFVLVLPETRKDAALTITDRIREDLEGDILPEKYRFVTASIGVASFDPEHPEASGIDVEKLLALADEALYHAKNLGRNRVVHADDSTEDAGQFRPSNPPDTVN
ncbi:MAG: diguanylate cyclase [Pseudomonadota bacterium]